MMAKDLLDELVEQLRKAAPDFPEARLHAAARKLRSDMQGAKGWIRKEPAAGKAWRLGEQLAAGVPLAQAFEAVGVSQSYGYKLARRRWRR
jgi:hypothetical protein